MELYPIRIDVSYPSSSSSSFDDLKGNQPPLVPISIRIIDTIVIDPNDLLIINHQINHDHHQQQEQERQYQLFYQWAYSCITDAMVINMKRHSSNNNSTLVDAVTTTNTSTTTTTTMIHHTTSNKLIGRYMIEVCIPNIEMSSTSTSHNHTIINTIKTYYQSIQESLIQQAIQQIQIQYNTIQHFQQQLLVLQQQRSSCHEFKIPIQIRMELSVPSKSHNVDNDNTNNDDNTSSQSIRIHDDFDYDIYHPSLSSNHSYYHHHITSMIPIAQSIVYDFNLPYDTIPIVLIHIIEQIIQYIHAKTTTTTNMKTSLSRDSSPTTTSTSIIDKHLTIDDDYNINDDGYIIGPIYQHYKKYVDNHTTTGTTNTKHPIEQQQQPMNHISAVWEIPSSIRNTNMVHLELSHSKRMS